MKNIVDIVTPFDFENNINYDELKRLLEELLKEKVDGIFLLGECSESDSLSIEEKKELIDFIVSYIDGRMAIYINLKGSINEIIYFDSIIKIRRFDSYVIEVNCGNELGIIKFYSYLADKLNKKIIVKSEAELELSLVKSLSYHPNIEGIILKSKNIKYLTNISSLSENNFNVYFNDDYLILVGICLDVEGIINVIGNAYPNIVREICTTTTSSKKTFLKYEKLITDIYEEQKTVGIKYLLKLKGVISDKTRLPLGICNKVLKRKIEEDYSIL